MNIKGPMREITEYAESELTFDEAVSIFSLTTRIWPKQKSIEQLAGELIDSARAGHHDLLARRFVIWEDGKIIAHTRTFVREILWHAGHDEATQTMKILALAAVCSDPAYRRQGLAASLVMRAFNQIGSDVRASLFQTGVPRFYTRLGCRIVRNNFVNSKNLDNPKANPWWDDQVMIYPSDAPWPDSEIDMNGPGY